MNSPQPTDSPGVIYLDMSDRNINVLGDPLVDHPCITGVETSVRGTAGQLAAFAFPNTVDLPSVLQTLPRSSRLAPWRSLILAVTTLATLRRDLASPLARIIERHRIRALLQPLTAAPGSASDNLLATCPESRTISGRGNVSAVLQRLGARRDGPRSRIRSRFQSPYFTRVPSALGTGRGLIVTGAARRAAVNSFRPARPRAGSYKFVRSRRVLGHLAVPRDRHWHRSRRRTRRGAGVGVVGSVYVWPFGPPNCMKKQAQPALATGDSGMTSARGRAALDLFFERVFG